MKISSAKIKMYSIALMVLVVLASILASSLQKTRQTFDIGDYSAYNAEQTISAYEKNPTPEGLAELCHVLCYQWKVAGNEQVKADFLRYGEILMEGAKEKNWDLEKLDNAEGTLLKVLDVLHEEGIR